MRGPKKVDSEREYLIRSAMYIKLRKDGFSSKSAANRVMTYMYDYLDLGPGYKILKSIIPFWSFTRQNIPFWMSASVQHPMAFSALSKAIGGVTSNPQSGELLPRIISEGIPIQISPTKNGKSTFMYSFGLSMEDLNRIVMDDKLRTLDKFFLSSLTPLLKFPLERSADKNFFFSTKI